MIHLNIDRVLKTNKRPQSENSQTINIYDLIDFYFLNRYYNF